MHFGATLRLLRQDAGFTLRDLAERVGVSNAYLSRVENGHDSPPSPDRLVALARALGLPPATLVEFAGRFVPFATDYMERIPALKELMLEIVRRDPSPIDIARIRAFVARELRDTKPARELWPAKLFASERVILDLTCDEIEDAIDVAAIRLVEELKVRDAGELAERIRARERFCSSAVGAGLAMPHAVVAGSAARAVLLTLRNPIAAATPDGLPLRLLVIHVHPGGAAHTALLSNFVRLAEPDTVARICTARKPAAAIAEVGAALRRA